jgi:hypothetical protein
VRLLARDKTTTPRLRWWLVLTAVVAASGTSAAVAASLGITPARLTVFAAATTVPVASCRLEAAADSYVDQLSLLSNFGGAATLLVRSSLAQNRRSFVRFDLSTCSIPPTARVKTAILTLFLATAPSSSRTYVASRATAAWSEAGLTWTNQPAVAGPTATRATGTTSGVALTWNVAADVQAFADGSQTNNGWRLTDSSEDAVAGQQGTLASRESAATAARPVLDITYYP